MVIWGKFSAVGIIIIIIIIIMHHCIICSLTGDLAHWIWAPLF
jgi:hypothetical protein